MRELVLPPRAEELGTADALLGNTEWVFAPGAAYSAAPLWRKC